MYFLCFHARCDIQVLANDATNNNRCVHPTFPPSDFQGKWDTPNFFGLSSRQTWKNTSRGFVKCSIYYVRIWLIWKRKSKPNRLIKTLELFCLSRGSALYIDFLQLRQLPNRVRGGVLSTCSSLKFHDAAVVACLQRRIEARSHAAGDWPPSSLQTDNSNDRLP